MYLCELINKFNKTIMVKNRFFILMLLSALFVGFTSCGGDDDKDTNYAKEIAGTYKGGLTMDMEGTPIPIADNVKIDITRSSNSKVIMKINQELDILAGMPLNIECPSDVTFKDGIYNITGKVTWMLLAAPIEVNGKINAAGHANINISVSIPGDGEMAGSFDVVFSGDKQ